MWNLNGLVAVVTGAGSGIGQATAVALAREGCKLALNDRNPEGLDATVNLLDCGIEDVYTSAFDVTDAAALQQFAVQTHDYFGRVDIVINNAGVALGPADSWDTSDEDWRWLMEINLFAVVNGTRAFMPYLIAAPKSAVCNVSSMYGLVGMLGNGAYCASKFAVRGFTETMRLELGVDHPHVLAMAIHPGGISTNIAHAAKHPVGTSEEEHKDLTKKFHDLTLFGTPERAARQIVRGLKSRSNRVVIGPDATLFDVLARTIPQHYDSLVRVGAKWMGLQRHR